MAERRVRLSDGAETTLERWGERGPLIVGVHGLGSSRRGWARIGEHLADRFRVAAFDQRGHGDSARVEDMTFARSVADVADVVAALGEPVHALIGHSWGGTVVVGAGRALEVGRVVAVDPMLEVEPGVWSGSVMPEYAKLTALSPEEREKAIRGGKAGLPEVEIEAKLHAARRMTLAPIAALGSENGIDDGRWDFLSLLDDYPRLLWVAVADPRRSVFYEADRAYARERGGSNLRLTVYEGAGHSLQREAFDRFMPDLESFLA